MAAAFALCAPAAMAAGTDSNRDRIPDRWEQANGLSLKSKQARKDPDRDRLNNLAEYRSGTNPRKADSDGDGLADQFEDRDHDQVDNGNESRERTLPNKPDSDRDGIKDGREDADNDALDNAEEDDTGNDPADSDSDDDGISDGDENAGEVVSFDGSVLTIRLYGGDLIKGAVNSQTEIYCDDEDGYESEDEWIPDDTEATQADDTDCSTDDLEPGTVVHEADAELMPQGLVFSDVDLLVEYQD
jgi:hypothetical protein